MDVDGLAPGAAAVVDATTLGYPRESLQGHSRGRLLCPGRSSTSTKRSIWPTDTRSSCRPIKARVNTGRRSPATLYSKTQKVHLDAGSDQVIQSVTDREGPRCAGRRSGYEVGQALKIHSELLSRFWGRPIDLGAVVLLPDGWEEHPKAHYPLIVYQNHFSRGLADRVHETSRARARVTSSIRIGLPDACRG